MIITKRLDYNIRICELLKEFLMKNTNIRFNQIIEILNGGEDRFDEEPEVTFKRFTDVLNGFKDR